MNAKRDEAVQSNHKPRYTVLSTGSGAIHLFVALALIEIKTGQPNVQPMLGYVEL
jgi:predicted ThiF/HesA family dinucleotide-utilizing enzyme